MSPIFNEYLNFLRDTTKQELPDLKEGYFWLDKQIIKGFDKQGNIHKFYRLKISDNLKDVIIIKLKCYTDISDIELASWNDLIDMNEQHLKEIETDSLNLIRGKMKKYKEYTPIVPVSMGKDSMVVSYLVRSQYPDTKAIFNNTSLDCADTYRMVKNFPNCEICTPKEGFYPWIKRMNWIPSRIRRGCCSIFKVGEMLNKLDKNKKFLLFMGMRNEESNTRSDYGDEVINPEWKTTYWNGILPIRKWSELDVWLYTFFHNIEINEKYKKGYSRVGCAIACPYYTKTVWILDKYWYPSMRKRWESILREYFLKNKGWLIFNCTIDEYLTRAWNGGTFRDEPTQEVIDEFAKYNGLDAGDTSVAKQYFNKSCSDCNKRIKDKTTLAMNMKFHGREITRFLCKKCFKKLYEMDEDKWNYYVAAFKRDDCALFDKDENS